MPCESCRKEFTLFRRKRACLECKRFYCVSCLVKRNDKVICNKCAVLTARPISRIDLQKLKPKDLIFYLQSKRISTAGCVEKEELINLVVTYATNSSSSNSPGHAPNQAQDDSHCTNPFDQIRQTCATIFTTISEKIASDLQKNETFTSAYTGKNAAPTVDRSNSTSQYPDYVSSELHRTENVRLQDAAGTSNDIPCPKNSTDTSSSFEEIGAVGGQSPDDWQFVTIMKQIKNPSESNGGCIKKEQLIKMKYSIDRIDKLLGERRHQSNKISRRRSDSDVSCTSEDIRDYLFNDKIKLSRKSCEKCNDASDRIRKRISEFRHQMEMPDVTEVENRRVLDAFLEYLETSSKTSVPHSPEEMVVCEKIRSAVETQTDMEPSTSSQEVPSDELPLERIPFDPKQRVDLTDINSSEDFDLLSVKQLKEILALNRVDYKGCCEKKELKERVLRLWKNHTSIPKPDNLPADDLCKICMDAPIECVILECGHLVACVKCSKILSECPICRAYIVRVVRFFRV